MMRPNDFNMAMRHDLVCILRDVVGLIARIEASIPGTGECAPRPVGDGVEAAISAPDLVKPSVVCSDGGYSVDAEAQKDSVDRTGRRNGSVGQLDALAGAEASPTPGHSIPDQPASVSPPDAAPAEPPAAANILVPPVHPASPQEVPSQTRTDHALDLWSTTELTEQQIAEQVGCALGSVKAFVSAARKKNDPRAFARKLAHDDKLSSPPAPKPVAAIVKPKPQPVLIPRKDEDREPPVSGFANSVERKPFSKPLDPRPGRLAGVVITSPGSVIALDMENLVVACPDGDWQVSRPVALIMERMRNGETFDDQTLAEVGTMGLSTFADSRKRWTEELAKLGVEFVHTKGVGCKIRVAGA